MTSARSRAAAPGWPAVVIDGLDDDHAAATAWAGMGEARRLVGVDGLGIPDLAVGGWLDEVIHHSDQESQYTSIAFGTRSRQAGVRPSIGSVGDAQDNALCESFFATLECELLDRTRFCCHAEARLAVFEFIEGWYNPRRRHPTIGYRSPIDYERNQLPPLAQIRNRPRDRDNSNVWPEACLILLGFRI